MKRLIGIAITLATTAPAAAKDPVFVVSKAISDKPTVVRDESMGYILLRADVATPMHFMKVPSPADQAAYKELRATALAKEIKKYPARLAKYKSDLALYEQLKKSGSSGTKPVEPIEPTEVNFQFTPFNLLAGASLGPMNRFTKGEKGRSVYLHSITPGTYRIYGLVDPLLGAGTCFCMGSVEFDVKAGEVTDLGTLRNGVGLAPVHDRDSVDPRLSGWPIHSANYRAVGKLPNYFGITLGRITPINGIIDYDRDRIIDLKASSASKSVESGAASTPSQSVSPPG